MVTSHRDFLGCKVGPYTLCRLIGEGGFAWVFEARHEEQTDPVALKLLKPRYSVDPEFEARFRAELTLAKALVHPNIVPVLEVGQSEHSTYYTMRLYQDSLTSLVNRDGPLSEDMLLRIARHVAAGLAFAHARGIVHRDIKGDNVLVSHDGTTAIGDFGSARTISEYVSATGAHMTIGTPQYISPEQAQGHRVNGRSDIYSLGITLYRAATGAVPFRSTDWFELARMHVEQKPVPPRKTRPDLSRRCERVILRCLAKLPDDRYASAEALGADLARIGDPERSSTSFGTVPYSISEIESPGRPPLLLRRRPWAATVLLLIVLVVALAFILGW